MKLHCSGVRCLLDFVSTDECQCSCVVCTPSNELVRRARTAGSLFNFDAVFKPEEKTMKIAAMDKLPCIGIDTFQTLTRAMCVGLKAMNVSFVMRYLDNLTAVELEDILDSGLACTFVHSCRSQDWIPTADLGTEDGKRDLTLMEKLGVPPGAHVWLDLEMPHPTASPDVVSAYVNNHAAWVGNLGHYVPALYRGAGSILSSMGVYAVRSQLYCRSCSQVYDSQNLVSEPACGDALVQAYPPNVHLPPLNLTVDWIYAQQDKRGRTLKAVARS